MSLYRQVSKTIQQVKDEQLRDELREQAHDKWKNTKTLSEEELKTLIVNGHTELRKLKELLRFSM